MVLEYYKRTKKKKKKTELWIEPDHNQAEYPWGQTSIFTQVTTKIGRLQKYNILCHYFGFSL